MRTLSAERSDENTGSDCRTDNTGNVRSHCVHKEEVWRIELLSHLVWYACGHWNGRDTSGTDERIDFLSLWQEEIHQLCHEDSGGSSYTEREKTKDDDSDVRLVAVKKLGDQAILMDIVQRDTNEEVCLSAIENIKNEIFLKDIANNSPLLSLRKASRKKLNEWGY